MIVYATNQQMHRAAEAGITFFRLIPGVYKITGGKVSQLADAGVQLRRKK